MKINKFKKQEILKLVRNHSVRKIATIVKLSKSTVQRVITRDRERKHAKDQLQHNS